MVFIEYFSWNELSTLFTITTIFLNFCLILPPIFGQDFYNLAACFKTLLPVFLDIAKQLLIVSLYMFLLHRHIIQIS